MILVGRYQSPFVRRVAISLRQLGLTYQHKPLSVIDDREAVKAINPLMRVPALMLEDGEVLIDSSAILDYIDERVGPARALIPPSGPERRKVLRLIALATGIMDKSVSYYQETRFRPEDKRHPGLLAYFTSQITQAFTAI
ncbi:MAG: glutathione S-transferase N-terminal domain-containing protein, partial [Rhodospirillales bacterium]|nr:glutathione S-transferase N-terminal domain-containing protein [Rhodospirillales bacterium]